MSFTESNTVEQMILDAATSLGSGAGSSVLREDPPSGWGGSLGEEFKPSRWTYVEATALQVRALAIAGSELVRVTVNTEEAAAAVPAIVDRLGQLGVTVPIVGDFHFNGHKLLREHPACAEALATPNNPTIIPKVFLIPFKYNFLVSCEVILVCPFFDLCFRQPRGDFLRPGVAVVLQFFDYWQ
jgi:hypothetical protein